MQSRLLLCQFLSLSSKLASVAASSANRRRVYYVYLYAGPEILASLALSLFVYRAQCMIIQKAQN